MNWNDEYVWRETRRGAKLVRKSLRDAEPMRTHRQIDRIQDIAWAVFAHALVGLMFLIITFLDYLARPQQ